MLRRYYQDLNHYLNRGRVLILYGARQVGKTTLLRASLEATKLKYRLDSGENIRIQHLLSSQDFDQILAYAEGYELIAIDEAQQIPNIGIALKILVDERPDLYLIATGSSSFDLAQKVGEPLTGRKQTLTLYPLSQLELAREYTPSKLQDQMEELLIFGSYPDVYLAPARRKKISLLQELVDSYLFKDILALEKIKSSATLLKLTKLLAFQIGQMVSLHELAGQLHIDVKTVERYLDLLEKTFIIKKLTPYSRNLRNEISKKCKYYFYDLGIRNGVISAFQPLDSRSDVGALWENFLLIERMKKHAYEGYYGEHYFWRTYGGQEIDLIEEIDQTLCAYEVKWSLRKSPPLPKEWEQRYGKTPYAVITPKNYLPFLTSS